MTGVYAITVNEQLSSFFSTNRWLTSILFFKDTKKATHLDDLL